MKFTISSLLSTIFLLAFMLSVFSGVGLLYLSTMGLNERHHYSQLSYLLISLKEYLDYEPTVTDSPVVRREISLVGTINEVITIAIINHKGIILYSNRFENEGTHFSLLSRFSTEEVINELKKLDAVTVKTDKRLQIAEGFIGYRYPSKDQYRSDERGLIYIRYNIGLSNELLLDHIINKIPIYLLIGAVLYFIVFLLISKFVIKPIHAFSKQAMSIAHGDYHKSVAIANPIELANLANSFEIMRTSIAKDIERLSDSHEFLETTVSERSIELHELGLSYKQAQAMAKMGRWVLDFSSEKLYLSDEALDIVGVPKKERYQLSDLFYNVADGFERKKNVAKILYSHDGSVDFEYGFRLHGFERWVRLLSDTSYIAQNKIFGIVQDITDQVLRDKKTLKNAIMLEAIVDTAADAIIVINYMGVVQEFSPAATNMFGYKKSEVLGQNVSMLMPVRYSAHHDNYLKNYHETGIKKIIGTKREVEGQRKNGSLFPAELSITETMIESEKYFTAVIRDISVRKKNDEILRKSMEDAHHASAVKSEFLANMSHEIRTPMGAIIGLSDLAIHLNPPTKCLNYLQKIYKSAVSLLSIIDNILDISKVESGKMLVENSDFCVIELLETVESVVRFKANEKTINLRMDIDDDVPKYLHGDSQKLRQVLINLIGNAIKFTGKRGDVTVKINPIEQQKDFVSLLFAVRDTGIGIAKDKLDDIFQSFTQEDGSITRRYGGTGLGLAISKEFVELMGGVIEIDSVKGEGTVFSFTLGFTIPATEPLPAVIESESFDNTLAGADILLVEDDDINQEIAVAMLNSVGINVTLAANGSEAVQQVQAKDFDLILMDCQMPVLDGYSATREIIKLSSFNHCAIIALTANVMTEDIAKAKTSGMVDYVSKPVIRKELYHKIAMHLNRKIQLENLSATPEAVSENSDELDAMIDLNAGFNHVNSASFYKQMLQKFEHRQARVIDDIETKLSEHDYEAAEIAAHTLKGQSGYLGFIELASLAESLEMQIKQRDESLSDTLALAKDALKRLLDKLPDILQQIDAINLGEED